MKQHQPYRFKFNIWLMASFDKLEYPYDGMTALGMTVGRHVLEVEYMQGSWWFIDRYGPDQVTVTELECKNPHRAYVLALRRSRQLGAY